MRIKVLCAFDQAVDGKGTYRAFLLDGLRQSSLARQESDRHFTSSASAISISFDGF